MLTVLATGLTVFTTHALEAVTGFGCTVLALPFVTALVGIKQGVQLLTILAWILAGYFAIVKRRQINWKQYGIITALMLCGLPIGMILFRTTDTAILKTILAGFIVASAAVQLLKLTGVIRITKQLPKAARWGLLVVGGIVHGMFSSGGPLVVLYATAAIPEKGSFRATLCMLWTTLNTILLATFLTEQAFVAGTGTLTAWMAPFLLAGIVAGEKIHDKVDAKTFSIIVFSMLLATGFIMLLFG